MSSPLSPVIANRTSVVIDGLEDVAFSVQSSPIPGMSADPAEQLMQFGIVPHGGSSIEYDPLELSFQVSDDLSEYIAVYNWMKQTHLGHGDGLTYEDIAKQITLTVFNGHYQPICNAVFYQSLPSAVSELTFTQEEDTVAMTATLTIKYSYYEFT